MKKIKPPIENKIYASIIGQCESMEALGIYKGNGHHLAQRLTAMVSAGILPKEQRKIFEVLTREPQTTKQIADKVKMGTRVVSAQLKNIYDTTSLVLSKNKNKTRKLWYLAN